MQNRLVQFRAVGRLDQGLQERTPEGKPVGEIARRDLARYYNLLKQNLPTFSLPEALLLIDALQTSPIEIEAIGFLWTNVENAIRTAGLDRKWQVDGSALVNRLRTLSPLEMMAIYDAIELVHSKPTPIRKELEQRLHKVGLVR